MVDKSKFAEEEARGYRVVVTGKNVHVTEAMKNHALEKIAKIERFHTHIMDIHITMDISKLEHSVMIVLKFSHFKVKVQASSNDMYVSIDKAVERLQSQLRRWKGKIQDHHKKSLSEMEMQVNVLERPYSEIDEFNADIERAVSKSVDKALSPPKIIGTEKLSLKMLNSDEAVMKMELSGDHFLIYKDEADLALKVIYRRSDGNYGIVQPR